jgi:hypothetical protein
MPSYIHGNYFVISCEHPASKEAGYIVLQIGEYQEKEA